MKCEGGVCVCVGGEGMTGLRTRVTSLCMDEQVLEKELVMGVREGREGV